MLLDWGIVNNSPNCFDIHFSTELELKFLEQIHHLKFWWIFKGGLFFWKNMINSPKMLLDLRFTKSEFSWDHLHVRKGLQSKCQTVRCEKNKNSLNLKFKPYNISCTVQTHRDSIQASEIHSELLFRHCSCYSDTIGVTETCCGHNTKSGGNKLCFPMPTWTHVFNNCSNGYGRLSTTHAWRSVGCWKSD
jgi:hypothetical protein